ncbi:AN1-type zinc finger protein 5 [Araneus ventricosus]|uniref:AN1-type zinc finger protein 5 n=1 Tax=Araneus ventricosus TaxID=182803 RepID=A0A4Y2ETE6_ARAVE|nr:AN1-type zinc finger protein 5 [Araneus ventricosus]
MSNRKGADNPDANNSESKSDDGKSPNTEANDPTQNPPQNPEVSQSNGQDNVDEESNFDPNLSPDETVIFEMLELSSEESSQGDNSNAVEGVKILYEFPDDSEISDVGQSIPQSQKRRNDDKNVNSAKKLKNDKPNTKDDKDKGNDYSNQDDKDAENNNGNSMEKRSSNATFDNHRLIAKPIRLLTKGKGNKRPTHIETHDRTNAFKRVTVAASTSEGALADVEDNADSQSNDDISDENEISPQKPISNNTNAISAKLVADREGTSSSIQSVDIDKESSSQNETKADSGTSRVVPESNTSSQPAGGKDGKASTSSAANQLKVKSDVERRKKRRCFVCNKKLGLTAFTCRCGGLYCSQHRYDREHDCTFDYKSMGAEEIRKNNPQIVAEKISKL